MNLLKSESVPQAGMIITDDVAQYPVLDFDAYANTICEIIKQSHPNFSIGIYGEWGTGKTTLMRLIESKLKDNESIVTVWFNAWRYEREEQFTIIPLLKKIAYSLPDKKEFEGLRASIKKGIGVIRRNLGEIVTSVVSDFVGQHVGENTENVVRNISNQLIPKIELLTEVNEKDTIYFDGLEIIEEEVKDIKRKGQSIRIVVFIDDLDRCSPKKTLEVFESVKVFLGVDGFVYLLGLSHETISKLITAEYGKSNSDIKGDQYIKKIIQIPITLPEWSNDDVSTLIVDFLNKGLVREKYRSIIDENKDSIVKAVENNPREVKRFINNFIVAHEILSRYRKVDAKELLLVQAINVRWNRFFLFLVKSTVTSRKELELLVGLPETERNKELDADTSEKNVTIELKRILRGFKMDVELWTFLKMHSQSIFGIKNWKIYGRAVESVSDYPTSKASGLWSTEVMPHFRKEVKQSMRILEQVQSLVMDVKGEIEIREVLPYFDKLKILFSKMLVESLSENEMKDLAHDLHSSFIEIEPDLMRMTPDAPEEVKYLIQDLLEKVEDIRSLAFD